MHPGPSFERYSGMTRNKLFVVMLVSLLVAGCGSPGGDQNIAIDNHAAGPTTVDVLPPDESMMPDAAMQNGQHDAAGAENQANDSH